MEDNRLETDITSKGWMTTMRFRRWVMDLDDQLSEPSLLILDSAPVHNHIEYRDPDNQTPWNHLTIVRLPKKSTPLTQPLDAGIISVFKRKYLQMLSRQTSIIRTLDEGNDIPRHVAWSIIPHAWSYVTAATIRHCFLNTPVLPEGIRQQLEDHIPEWQEQYWRPTMYQMEARHRKRMEVYFSELVASVTGETVHTVKADPNKEEMEIVDEMALAEADNWKAEGSSFRSEDASTAKSSPIGSEDWEATKSLLSNLDDIPLGAAELTTFVSTAQVLLDHPHPAIRRAAKGVALIHKKV